MASNIPTRRVTHARIAVHKDENANARPRALRTKPPSTNGATASNPAAPSLARATTSTRAKVLSAKDVQAEQDAAAGKRKRSAFGEVVVNKPKASKLKGKDKDDAPTAPVKKFDGVVLKTRATTTTTTTATATTRAPLRSVAAPAATKRTTRSTGEVKTQHVPAAVDDAMLIDPPALIVPARRVSPQQSR
ncbi:hypothetical protein OF83DRAFT_1171523, partial [Amylostereum chailletii]